MKEPPLSRRKKPTTAPPKKLKLVCRFNGIFQPRPPSGNLRYVGGETRIISFDRSISFSKLRSKISDLCPNTPSFSLKYHLPESDSARYDDDSDTPLVLITSDDDVRCMMEEYEKVEMYGKHTRLWVFVCANDGNNNLHVSYNDKTGFEAQNCETNSGSGVTGVRYSDDLLRKIVLKQQLLVKQSAQIHSNGTEMEFACCVENQKYEHPLIDLAPEPQISVSNGMVRQSFEDPYRVSNMFNCNIRNLEGSENYGNLDQFRVPRSHPLNPRDGNLPVETNRYGKVLCNEVGNSSQLAAQFAKQRLNSMYNGLDAKQDLRNIGQTPMSNFNRENIMPCAGNFDSGKTNLALSSSTNQLVGSAYPMKYSFVGNKVSGGSQSGIRNHKIGVNDCRTQRIYPYHVRNNRSNMMGIRDHRTVRFDGRVSLEKCYPGLRPNSNISKQGQYMRMYYPNTWKPWSGFHDHVLEGRKNLMDSNLRMETSSFNVQYSDKKFMQQGSFFPQYGNSNPQDSHSACHGTFAGDNESVLSCNLMESPSPGMTAMDTQEDFLTAEVPNQTLYKNSKGIAINCEQIPCDLDKGCILMDQQMVANNSGFSNNSGCVKETESGCNTKFLDAQEGLNLLSNYNNGIHTLQGGIASSVGISLFNLSLSSVKEVERPALSSIASSVVCETLLKPQTKPLNLMDEVPFSTGQQVHESNEVASDPSSQNASKLGKDHVQEEKIQQDPLSDPSFDEKADIKASNKCSKVIGGISGDLAAFYTHLATRELQTIKNSDLEYIKELGSGTYGTVFYGKWKGSDVAIKRLKPSCFTEGEVEEDRLIADFWREAHILGQLHHPNIVAFYGVVTDGPMTNLATVTEHMVNGSLKQVLRKRDRTIDRWKRIIIAMDAAFGMEYLHEKNIVHFDLKSHNFLVNIRDPQRPVCKIGDLGLSKIKQKTLVSGGVRGTIPWMAPELLNSKNTMVTEKVDVYSFGIVMWELLTGEEPYRNLRSEEIIAGIIKGNLRPEIPSWCDRAWRSLMENCWSSDPDSRPSFSDIAKELCAMSAAMNIK